jgi:threonyl-tRNA synthetase
MRILQLDVNSVEYELIKPEAKVYEKSDEKQVSVKNALLLLTSIEKGDDSGAVEKAINAAVEFARKQKIETIVIYPFAHLSGDLEVPSRALEVLNEMRALAGKKGVNVISSPFGWNKKLKVDIKGHPLAEMSRTYGASAQFKASPAQESKPKPGKADLSIVRKSNWSGLPINDHRTIGEQLDLYSFQEVSPSMVYWHPNGYTVYKELMSFIRQKESEYGYREVSTPVVANTALWHVSGHILHYYENMFVFSENSEELGLKPMSCPSTILIYKSKSWSYKELPFRTAIFDKLYRKENSGSLTGLFRVQELTQDDGHIFLSEGQIEGEIGNLLKMVKEVYETFEMKFVAYLSTMPESHMGDEKLWERATIALKGALEKNGINYRIKDKEGAFYGPKIDFDVLDAHGRSWQCATIQVDYQQPLRFGIEYTGEDGKQQTPVLVHRAILGSLERFIAILVEHYQGKFPTWLAPTQVRVASISDQTNGYAKDVYKKLAKGGIRVELDSSSRTIEYKIRDSQMMKVPYTIVVGKKEVDAGTVAVRSRSGKQKFGVPLEDFINSLNKEIKSRSNTETIIS